MFFKTLLQTFHSEKQLKGRQLTYLLIDLSTVDKFILIFQLQKVKKSFFFFNLSIKIVLVQVLFIERIFYFLELHSKEFHFVIIFLLNELQENFVSIRCDISNVQSQIMCAEDFLHNFLHLNYLFFQLLCSAIQFLILFFFTQNFRS